MLVNIFVYVIERGKNETKMCVGPPLFFNGTSNFVQLDNDFQIIKEYFLFVLLTM